MFDITALQSVTVTGFDIDAYGNTHTYEIYYKAGTHVGFENTAGAWTLVGTAANVAGNPRNSPTSVPITLNVAMCGGETHAFYITSTGASGSISYTNGTGVGNIATADANIQVREGTGKDYAFGQSFLPRLPNLTVYYDCTQSCCTPPTMSSTQTSCSGACDGTATATVGTGGVPPYTYLWDSSAGNQTTQTATNLCAGTYTVMVTDATGCEASETVTVTDGAQSADATINPAGPFCETDGAVTLSATDPGGTWSGTGITNPSTGVFDPATAGPGTHTITYSISGPCGDSQTTTITVNGQANSTINPAGPFCLTDPPYVLTAATPGGTWTGTGIISPTGVFDPGVAGAGTWTILYQITGSCGSFSSSSITVNSAADATITTAGPYCANDPAVTLTANQAGGTWSGTGITDPVAGTFDPATAGQGSWNITYTITGACGDTDDQVITVNPASDATINPAGPFCLSDPPVTLTAADPGGIWIGAGITNSSTGAFDPSVAGLGTWTIVYNIPGVCGDVQTTQIAVTNAADATISPVAPTCSGLGPITLNAATPGGTWSGTGITDPVAGIFDPSVSGAGSFVVTYTLGGNCGDVDTETVTILQSSDATIDPIPTICTTDPPFNFTAADPGGTWGGMGITDPFQGTFDPSLVSPGTWIVNYSINGFCSDNDTYAFTVSDGGDPTIDPVNPLCPSDPAFNMTAADPGGTWSGTGITDATAGTFDPSVAGPGNHTITYAVGGACGGTDTEVVQVSSTISLTTSLDQQSNCGQADGIVSVSASGGTVANDYSYSWNSTPIQTTASANGLLPATYMVTVTDDLNCSATATVDVTATSGFTASIASYTDASCYQACDGTATSAANAGSVPPLTYSWNTSPAQTSAIATNLCAGSYDVTITDNVGCSATASVTISEPTAFTVTATASVSPICSSGTSDLSAAPTGGTPNYTYAWSATPADPSLNASSQNPTVSPTVSTTYTVVVTDANGCTATDQVTVDVSSALTLSISLDQPSNCGQSDGIVSVTASGGIVTTDYTYSWDSTPTQTTATATGLGPGTYTVTVTDDVGCSETSTVDVTTSAGFTASISTSTDASCNQACDGIATVTVTTGSTAPLSYSWNTTPTQTGATANNLCAGTYDMTVTDAVGCSASTSITISEPAAISVSASSSVTSICDGETADLTASPTGGTQPLTYAWSSSPNDPTLITTSQNPSVSPTASTTYTITVSDANGCTATDQVTVDASPAIVLTTSLDQESNCGQPDGIVSVSATGGTVANDYSYSWDSSPAQNTATASNLTAGTYNVTVTDDLGCTETASILLTSTAGFTADITTSTDASCFQGCDGTATVAAGTGSVTPVTYSWNTTPPQTTDVVTGLCAGTYDVTVTDNTGCSATTAVTIGEASELTITATASSPLICVGQSSDLTATASGGTPAYASYNWTAVPADPSLNATAQNPTVFPTVNTVYTVEVTDANGCTASASVSVDISPAISVSTTLDQESVCAQPDGVASVTASGGTVANDYTYAWNTSPIQTGSTANGLAPGTYTVVVTDDLGCSDSAMVDVTSVGGFTANIDSYTDVSCFQSCDGTATASAGVGSITPVTYQWNTNPVQTTATATGLCTGTYEVVITDDGGCSDTAEVIISESSLLEVMAGAGQTVICNGASTLLGAVPSGGTQPYVSYNWTSLPTDPSLNATDQNPSVSPAVSTTYLVTVTDANGCTALDTVSVGIAPDIVITTILDQESHCEQADGSATASAAGGIVANDYSYSWDSSPAQNTATATGLAPGSYNVTVTDDLGCSATETIVVTATTGFTASISSSSDVSCYQLCDGEAMAAAGSGSTGALTYSWNTTPAQTTQTATGLCAGSYDVVITDAVGCQGTTSVTISEPTELTATALASLSPICIGDSSELSVTTNGGTLPIASYSWSAAPADGSLSPSASNPIVWPVVSTNYDVTITDSNGCSTTASTSVDVSPTMTLTTSMDQPSNCGLPDGVASVSASGGIVANDYAYSWSTSPAQNTATATGLAPNIYTVTVTDDAGCSETADIEVTETAGFTASISVSSDASCYQQCDGEATVVASAGNTPPLTYLWNSNPAQYGATATSLCAGTFDVTVTDAVGCIATASVTVAEPTELVVTSTSSVSPICIGQSSDLTAMATGGTAPYQSYNWTASPTDSSLNVTTQHPTVSPESTTNYEVTVTDANGCEATGQVSVEVLPALTLDIVRPLFNSDTAICPYDEAILDVQASGGDGNYAYYLQPASTPATLPIQVQPNETTTYVFVVEDGCTTPSDTAQSTVTVHTLPEIVFEGDELSGCHVHAVQFTDNTIPEPVAYSWNFGDSQSNSNTSLLSDPNHTFSNPGIFDISLSIETAEGCVADTTYSDYVEVFPLPKANFSYDPSVANILDPKITYTDQSTGDIESWYWDFGTGDTSWIQNPQYTYLDTGVFITWLTVTTVDGCISSTRGEIRIEPSFTFYVPNAFTPNGDERNDYFRGYGEGVDWDSYQMSIYNRWGEEIYYTNNVNQPWDGTFKGQPVEMATYVYVIHLNDVNGNDYVFRDGVSLIR